MPKIGIYTVTGFQDFEITHRKVFASNVTQYVFYILNLLIPYSNNVFCFCKLIALINFLKVTLCTKCSCERRNRPWSKSVVKNVQ